MWNSSGGDGYYVGVFKNKTLGLYTMYATEELFAVTLVYISEIIAVRNFYRTAMYNILYRQNLR